MDAEPIRVADPAPPARQALLQVGWPARSRSRAYREAIEHLVVFAPHDVALLLEGESGTGKMLLARQLHGISGRRAGPFRLAQLGAMYDSLAYSDLFGHVAGAFTDARQSRKGFFASASGGTLFLDEIGKASAQVQKMLLHAVEHQAILPAGSDRELPVNVRVFAASNVPLAELAQRGEFLADLYARLNGFRVVLPPLRKRVADIPVLAEEIVQAHAPSCRYLAGPSIESDLMDALVQAEWPDNLRGLDAAIHRMMILAWPAPRLSLRHCTGDLAYLAKPRRPKPGSVRAEDVQRAKEITKTMEEAAQLLGLHRTTAHKILRRARERGD